MAHKILLVDDDAYILKTFGLALHRAGYETQVALNGPDALKKIQEYHPDLVILDVMLPGMSGHEVCQHIRQTAETEHVLVIMLSALGRVEDKVAGFAVGADDYLVKPVPVEELLARARALLARSTPRAAAPPSKARVISFVGVKGGVGTSTLAVNTGIAATQAQRMTILAELHPRGGTAAAQLGQAPRQNLHTLLAQEAAAITPNMVQRYLLVYRSGLQVLPAPLGPPEQPNQLTAEHMEALVSILAGKADVLILDLESALTPAVQVAVRRSDRIVLVSEPDDIAAKITQCWLEALATLGIGGSLLNIVTVNRGGGTTAYTKTQLEELFGSDVVMISSAPEMCLVANRTSTPVILQERNTPLEQQLRTLAQHLIQG